MQDHYGKMLNTLRNILLNMILTYLQLQKHGLLIDTD